VAQLLNSGYITISGWYVNDANKLSGIEFSDGTFWATEEIVSKYDGENSIQGTDSNDTINGTPGDDMIIGFKGSDTLRGGEGDDTYVWNTGDGIDTIEDDSGYTILKFGEGIVRSDITLLRSGDDLLIYCRDGGRVTVKNWNPTGENSLGEIQFGAVPN
jgi:Ca2+-binding RTX toxin-like protein